MIYGIVAEPEEEPFGCGKTLFMSWRGYLRWKRGQRVMANYGILYPHEPLNAARLVSMEEDLQDCVILGDEFEVILDSRLGMKGVNIAITYFVLQTRKRNVTLFYTSQYADQVDKRLRRVTDYWIYCKKVRPHVFRYRLFSRRGKYLGTIWIKNARRLYGLFDTRQTIRDFTVGLGT